jgi:hypothetical protein
LGLFWIEKVEVGALLKRISELLSGNSTKQQK